MAKLSRTEFAEECGVTPVYLTQYIKRGKVIIDADGSVDTKKRINLDFKEARTDKSSVIIDKKPVVVKESKSKLPPLPQGETASDTRKYNLELQLKHLTIEKAEQEVELNRIRIAKQTGEVIPTDLVRVVVAQIFKGVTTAFHQGCDNFISVIAKQTGMNATDKAKLRGELIGIVNQSVIDGQAENKANIKNIVEEYSEKRGQGEKK